MGEAYPAIVVVVVVVVNYPCPQHTFGNLSLLLGPLCNDSTAGLSKTELEG